MHPKITWLGHDTFDITGNSCIIYTDPFQIHPQRKAADIILITHSHRDHCSPDDIARVAKDSTTIIATHDCTNMLPAYSVQTIQPGDTLKVKGVIIEAVPAYNTNKAFHPRSNNWVGYIFTMDGKRIYHAGDTDRIPEMKKFQDIDIALLPVSGTYVMTAEEAVEAAMDIVPKLAIPMHYGSVVGSAKDAESFKQGLVEKIPVTILHGK